jgi:DNA-binding response OmpR family regulator
MSSKNPYRKRLTAEEACEGLSRFSGSIFDETVLDVLRRVVLGDDQRSRMGMGKRVLIVEPDPEESTVLEMRLVERGLEVSIVRDAASALDALASGDIELVVSEVELGERDGFWLLERIRASATPELPVILHTRKGDRESVSRGFELSVVDYVLKPASPDVVAAKVHKTLETTGVTRIAGRGVSGSLKEMSLSDVIQLLANGRKSGRLQINSGGLAGDIGFAEGQVFEASFGNAVGEEAVYAMIVLEDGEFALDTTYMPRRNTVNVGAESLLLEGMRRMDEQRR